LSKIYTNLDANELSVYDYQKIQNRNKAVGILEILNENSNIDKLRAAAFYGIPSTNKTGQSDLRSIVWRVLLGVLP